MMDDLKYICMKIDNCEKSKLCFKNKVICTKRVLERYIGNDYDKMLKLEAELNNYEKPNQRVLSQISLFLSFLAVVTSIIYSVLSADRIVQILSYVYGLFVLLSLAILLIILHIYGTKNKCVNRWKEYIWVVLKNMEKEYESSNK